jgi:xanthine dehydrogenase YagT iron-sulfur-binding subunit
MSIPSRAPVSLKVNGRQYQLYIEPRRTLLDALRIDLGLTGTKKSCDEGQCGACTDIYTIEGLADGETLHPLQAAFIEHDGYQCGFCTPGQILAAATLLADNANPSEADIQYGLAGNLCRCGAYRNIIASVQAAAQALAQDTTIPTRQSWPFAPRSDEHGEIKTKPDH